MMTDPDDKGGRDATRAGMPPPPGAKAESPPKDRETDFGRGVPILPGGKAPSTTPAAEPKAGEAQPADAAEDKPTVIEEETGDLEATVIGEIASPHSLMRLKPAGHPMPITLTRNTYVLGRGGNSDLALFSKTAHRRHAKLSLREGAWILEPFENNIVIANGDLVRGSVRLVHKMRLQFGDDELMFFDEYKAGVQTAHKEDQTREPAPNRRRIWLLALLAAVVAVVFTAVVTWLRGQP